MDFSGIATVVGLSPFKLSGRSLNKIHVILEMKSWIATYMQVQLKSCDCTGLKTYSHSTLANQEMEKHWNILDLFILFFFFVWNDVDARVSVPLRTKLNGMTPDVVNTLFDTSKDDLATFEMK
jgi:hypothetical protein